MNARRVQFAGIATSALLLPAYLFGSGLIWSSKLLVTCFLTVLYVSVVAALLGTLLRYRNDKPNFLAPWRRKPYVAGLAILLALCVLPLATWPIAFSGIDLHLRVAVFCLLGLNAAAAILVWFGKGWPRVGLTVIAFWVLFLWLIPLGFRE